MDNKYKIKRYWPVPPIIESVYEYQNVNSDKNLQKNVTMFFYNKLLSWINNDNNFNKFIKFKSINTKISILFIYKILQKFISKTNINWYDLRDNYKLIKKYIYIKLSSL